MIDWKKFDGSKVDGFRATNWWEASDDKFLLVIAEYLKPQPHYTAAIFFEKETTHLWASNFSTLNKAKEGLQKALDYVKLKRFISLKALDMMKDKN